MSGLSRVAETRDGPLWPAGHAVAGSGASDRVCPMERSGGSASFEIWTVDALGVDVFTGFTATSDQACRFLRAYYDQPSGELRIQRSNTGSRWQTIAAATVTVTGLGVTLFVHARVL